MFIHIAPTELVAHLNTASTNISLLRSSLLCKAEGIMFNRRQTKSGVNPIALAGQATLPYYLGLALLLISISRAFCSGVSLFLI